MRRSVVVVLALLLALVATGPVGAQSRDSGDGASEVTFVHGIRGFFTDVYLDGELILEGFAPERITEPLRLEPGEHTIDLRPADGDPAARPDITKTFDVPANGKLTAVAHWTGVDECVITLFDETGTSLKAGSGRLVARHTAATGGVQVALDRNGPGRELAPDGQIAQAVSPGDHTVSVQGLGEDGSGSKASTVPVAEGGARVVYLVGSAKNDTLGLLTQSVEDIGSNPDGVPTGDSGLAAAGAGALPSALVLLLLVLGGTAAAVRLRRTATGA